MFSIGESKHRVKLRDIQVLTLYSDRLTEARRSSPIKQLNCVGGYCNQARIYSAQCYNRGFDGRDAQWECKAEMPSNYKFGKLEVSCEGYDYPEDDYILAGSCGLEYTIVETQSNSRSNYFSDQKNSDISSLIPIIAIIAIIIFIYYTCLRDTTRSSSSSSYDGSDDSGGFPFFSSPQRSAPPPGFRYDIFGSGDSCSARSQNSWPGFWTGLTAGGFLGYLFGSNSTNRPRSYYTQSNWDMPSTSSYYSSDSMRSRSNRTSESTGFASTTRR